MALGFPGEVSTLSVVLFYRLFPCQTSNGMDASLHRTAKNAVDHTFGIAAPAQDNDDIFFGFDEDNITSGTPRGKTFFAG